MESQHFGHEHPLAYNEELSNQSEEFYCSRCDEVMSGPSFSCVECEFFLHKKCAEAPSEINHPFHRNHPLGLLPNPPEDYGDEYICNFCGMRGRKFAYHCSCKIDLHIKCALFTYNIAKKNFGELQHIALKDPWISTANNNEEVESAKCYGCWKPLLDSVYFDQDCGFNLHKKCAELPLQTDCVAHRKHPLFQQFAGHEWFSCKVCQETQLAGFVYCCSLCSFALHRQCVAPPPILEDKSHEHPFTLLPKEVSFICNICGTQGNSFPYVCCTCGLMVHMKCISLPQAIKMTLHDHPILRTYFLRQNELKEFVCIICQEEVNTEYGSYYCSICGFIVHVNCATQFEEWYYVFDLENKDDNASSLDDNSMDSITEVIERNEAGEATKIKHFSHEHDLLLSEKIMDNDECCDGCMLFISSHFFYCSQCDFFLHKSCAELPRKKLIWFHTCRCPPILSSDGIFTCLMCDRISNGFAYKCKECKGCICLQCAIPFVFKHEGHEHPLFFDFKYDGKCNCCGDVGSAYKCKRCNFALDFECVILPRKIQHKCDKHILLLTYHEENNYPESHYCDICEEKRDSNWWFYHCKICDTSAHIKCVLVEYPFFKPGRTCEEENHPHPLTFVKNIHFYPDCLECCEPCQGLALECLESGCNYIVHWDCVCPYYLHE